MGQPIGDLVGGFFGQLDPRSSEISNGHWREYTGPEVRRMLEPLGFRIQKRTILAPAKRNLPTHLEKNGACRL